MRRAGSLALLSIVAFGVLPLTPARAFCMVQPFDRVIRQADAVLVATVADAQVGPRGLVLRLDVEQALKGSPADGERVRWTSCGPMITPRMERRWARQMIGERGLYILTGRPGGLFTMYGQMTSPPMKTLQEQITRAAEVLGVTPTPTPSATSTPSVTPSAPPSTPPVDLPSQGGTWWLPWLILLVVVGASRGLVLLARRHRRKAAQAGD